MIFIDSDMWCYYFDQRLAEHGYVREPMREIVCNTIIVMEVAHYLVRYFQAKAARRKIECFVNLENMKIIDFDRRIMMEFLDSLVEHAYTHGLGGRDATIIATLKKTRRKQSPLLRQHLQTPGGKTWDRSHRPHTRKTINSEPSFRRVLRLIRVLRLTCPYIGYWCIKHYDPLGRR